MVTLPTGPTISCPWLHSPVAVIATYAGLPVAGATVTLFYLGPGAVKTYKSVTTNSVGLAQECIKDWVYVEARIQKTGVNFGSGNGVQHIIGGKSGADRFFSGTFFIVALPCELPQVYNPITSKCETPPAPPPLPCGGSISIEEPDFTSLLSGLTLPPSIPVPFTITPDSGSTLPASIPLRIFFKDKAVYTKTGQQGANSIDILAIIRSLGTAALTSGGRLSIRADLPKCNIPAQGLDIPPLVPAVPTCLPGEFLDPITKTCKPLVCPPGQYLDPFTLTCKSIECPPGQILDPITKTCKTIVCPPGEYLDPFTLTCKSLVCPAGQFLDPITKTCKPIVCPAGEYLDPYTLTCKPLVCPAGEYLDPFTLTCKPLVCPAGQFLDPITKTCKTIVCPAGQFLDPFTLTCKSLVCPAGEYLDPITKTCKPIVCPAGEFLDPYTLTCKPITCPAGQYLDPITKTCKPIKCPAGEYLDPITKTCVPVTPKEVCQIGDVRKISCPDGTEIVIEKCEKDPTTGRNRWVPTGNTCPPLEMGKIVKILTYPEGAALEAYDGQEVTVTASVVCGLTLSSGETAVFEVDGNKVAQETTSSGTVSFKWKATPEPSRTHKLCVSVPKSAQCPKYGSARDCKTITVSRIIPGIEEQLRKEREEYAKGIEALMQERERIRQLLQPAISLIPTAPVIPTPFIPFIPTIPTIPPGPEVPKQGKISIPSVEILPGVAFPVIIYIDGERIGSPPVMLDADPGTHTVRIQLKGFTPISKKVSVIAGETTQITDLRFV